MNEKKSFSTESLESKKNEVEPFIKTIEAEKDGKCAECQGEYKKGDQVELILTQDDIDRGLDKPSVYCSKDCSDERLMRKPEDMVNGL